MTERLLQFIWQFQYFNAGGLETVAGEQVRIIHPGQWNSHQGPDFSNARVQIGNKIWAGNVELHVRASDWRRHSHHTDRNYDRVILHVVWLNDEIALSEKMPTVVLEDRIPVFLLQQYELWMNGSAFIPCASQIGRCNALTWISWKERLLVERLQRKYRQISAMLVNNHLHWEETLWWLLARNFGLYVNADAFEEMARSVPFKVLRRHRTQIHQLEALLLGQAGLLEGDRDDSYFVMLKKEYRFYRSKYDLAPIHAPVHFLRMRPPSFPTVRLAQLAMLLHTSESPLSSVLDATDIKSLLSFFDITANDYWHYHFTFDQVGACHPKTLGAEMIRNLIVNTAAPLVYAYGFFHNDEKLMVKAMEWLSRLPAEKNTVTRGFREAGVSCSHASDSQALTELKTQYCDKRRCLDCAVGNSILKHNA